MPTEICEYDGQRYEWTWEEAFQKFGFNDGAMGYLSHEVADVLRNSHLEPEVVVETSAIHNAMVVSIKLGEIEQIPYERPKFHFGRDCPRKYLSDEIVAILDQAFNHNTGEPA